MSTIAATSRVMTLTPTAFTLFDTIRSSVNEIKPSERIQIQVPKEYSHDCGVLDYDFLERLQRAWRGSTLRPNVFVTLRFDKYDEESNIVVDICHL